jgi:methionyl-tRNA formyltransferase
MKVLFIGSMKRGYLALKALVAAGADLAGVISLRQDEHETERFEGPIAQLASELHVPLCETKWLNDRDYADIIRNHWRPDIGVVVGCRLRLPREIYTAPPAGTLAVHDSCLPEYRGFAPLNWAILNGVDHTGVTLFYVTDGVDAGDIVAEQRIPIGPDETAAGVYERVCEATATLLRDTYPLLAAGRAPRRTQDPAQASYTCPRVPADGLIDWNAGTIQIYNQVRALTRPYPGAFTYSGMQRLTIWRAVPVAAAPRYVGRIPGRVSAIDRGRGTVDVLTGDGVLRLHEVQLDDGNPQPAAAVIRSIRATLGVRIAELMERIAELRLVGHEGPTLQDVGHGGPTLQDAGHGGSTLQMTTTGGRP